MEGEVIRFPDLINDPQVWVYEPGTKSLFNIPAKYSPDFAEAKPELIVFLAELVPIEEG